MPVTRVLYLYLDTVDVILVQNFTASDGDDDAIVEVETAGLDADPDGDETGRLCNVRDPDHIRARPVHNSRVQDLIEPESRLVFPNSGQWMVAQGLVVATRRGPKGRPL